MRRQILGVTLIELLVTLLILSISFSLAIPGFQGMMRRNRIATQTNEMLSAINLARSEAGKMGQTVSVQATDDSDSDSEFGLGFCVVAGNPGDCTGTLVRSFDALTEGTTLNSVEDVSSIQFDPLGALGGGVTSLSLDLCYPEAAGRRIFINIIGRSKSHKPDDPDTSKRPEC